MAKLVVVSDGFNSQTLILRVGANVAGRHPDCAFQIDHFTVSSRHCEFILSPDGVLVRDLNSTNGTFVNSEPVKEAWLCKGQTVHLGNVELIVEDTEIVIAIPQAPPREIPRMGVGSPAVLPPGTLVCSRHEHLAATYKCTGCSNLSCGKCVRSIKRKGGQPLFICPVCNGKCLPVARASKKKTFMDTLRRTVKMPFMALTGRSSTPE